MSIRRILLIMILIEIMNVVLCSNRINSSEETNSVEIFNHNLESKKEHQVFNTSFGLNVKYLAKRAAVDIKNSNKRSKRKKTLKRLTNCKKLDFNVDFVELGWDKWIIFPKMFNAHICSGDCSLNFSDKKKLFSSSRAGYVQVTNHAQIMSILENKHPNLSKQMTKCVSTRLKPLTVVFLDDNGFIKTKQYEDMIVDECGCR